MYKNFNSGKYVLHRLYKDGKRYDLEEQHDIAAESPEIVKKLAAKLEKYLKDYDAKLPYKDPSKFKNEEDAAAIPVIVNDVFDANSRTVSIQLEKGKSNVIESYALIKISDKPSATGKKKLHTTYIKVPLESSKDKLEYTFNVPKDVHECGVIFIDENRFMVKSKFHELIKAPKKGKKKKGKKKKKKELSP